MIIIHINKLLIKRFRRVASQFGTLGYSAVYAIFEQEIKQSALTLGD
jgi:hypothetical protein